MGRKLVAIGAVWVLACALVAAADFWEEKAFPAWSDKNVEKMMTDSPWAKRITVVFPRPPQASPDSGGRGRGRGGGFGGGSPQSRLVVSWRSALPVRQALVRAQIGEDGTVPPEAAEALGRSEPGYYVAVTGVPRRFARLTPEQLMAETRLERKGKAPIMPVKAGTQPDGPVVALVYIFPKDDVIALEDKDVEFITKVGGATIKRKFKLEDMVFHGQLEL